MRATLSDLRIALDSDSLVPLFQPIVQLKSGEFKGFELLTRWRAPSSDLTLPDNFISLAEENGLISTLTQQILRKAFEAVAEMPNVRLAANVSPLEFRDRSMPEMIGKLAEQSGFSLSRLTIEITESAIIDNIGLAAEIAKELKARGCRLALDDFGTGYSSLLHLQALPFDQLKIDRSFVQAMIVKRESRKIVGAVVGLGRSLGIATVAEGVETEEQAEMVLRLGCDHGQGWFYGRPVQAESIPAILSIPPRTVDFQPATQTNSKAPLCLEAQPADQVSHLRAIYDGAPVGLCFLDREFRHVSLNRRLAEINGLPILAHLGKTVADINPRVFALIEPLLRRVLLGEEIADVEILHPESKPGENRTFVSSFEPAFDEIGEVVGISIAIVEITERKRAEEALRESENHYRNLFELSPLAPWVMDPDGNLTELSQTWINLTGLTREQSLGAGWLTAVHPDDIQARMEAHSRSRATGEETNIEYRLKAADGTWRWVRSRGRPCYGPSGEVVRWYGCLDDIDAQKRADDNLSSARTEADKAKSDLRQHEARFREILTHLPDVAWTVGANGTVHYMSPNVSEFTGYSADDIYAGGLQFLVERVHPDDRVHLQDELQALFSEGKAFNSEFRFQKMDGTLRWFHSRSCGTYLRDDEVLADGIVTDISLQKAAENELKSKTALLEAQINSTIDGILVVDSKEQRILENKRFAEIFRLPADLLASRDGEPSRNYAQSLMKNPEAFKAKFEYLNEHPMESDWDEIEFKDGTILDRYSSPAVDNAGNHYGRIWTFRDVTERRRNEDSLRKLSLVVEQSPAVVVITDRKGNITYVNSKFTECTGYTPDEVVGKNPKILNSGYSSPETYRDLWSTITRGGTWRGEFRNKRKSGEHYWEEAIITPILNSSGEITNFVAMKEDITSRKLAENKLEIAKTAAEDANRSLQTKHLALERERRILDALIDNVPDFMYVKDTESKFIVANAQTARAMKVVPKDLVGKSDFDFLPSDMARGFYEDEQAVLKSGEPLYNHEETCLDEAGNQIQILTTKVPIRDGDGKITGIAGVGRNITARKRMENALRDAEQKYRGIFDNAVVGIFQSTPAGKFLSANLSMAAIFGYDSPEEMLALVTDIERQLYVAHKDRDDFKSRLTSLGGVQNFECEGLRKDGTRIWVSLTVRGIFENNELVRLEGMCSDITERRSMEAQLRQAQKLEGIGQLAAGIAHEINTPTQFVTDNLVFLQNAWNASAEMLKKYKRLIRDSAGTLNQAEVAWLEHEEKNADLDFISTEVPLAITQGLDGMHRVARIVKAMKEFSHPDSAEQVQLDLNRAIESTITVARNEWKYVADIDTDFEPSLPLIVCHPGEINQVILNLIVNAAHAINEKATDGERGKITISTRSRDHLVEIAIADTGAGIPYAIQTRIYEPFFTTKDVGKGTGQGLALAHSVVVKKHHGKIWFTTEIGKGTTFFINLPLEPEKAGKELDG